MEISTSYVTTLKDSARLLSRRVRQEKLEETNLLRLLSAQERSGSRRSVSFLFPFEGLKNIPVRIVEVYESYMVPLSYSTAFLNLE